MISVVVAAYNEEKTLGCCLDHLVAQSAPGDGYEIIVADDGSSDQTRAVAESRVAAAMARSTCLRVVTQANQGPGAAPQPGREQCPGRRAPLCRCRLDSGRAPGGTDGYCVFGPDPGGGQWREKKPTKLISGRAMSRWNMIINTSASPPRRRSISWTVLRPATGARFFLSNGGFDTTLKEAEDTEFSFRLAERGYRMVLVPGAITYHTHPESLVTI